MSFVHLRYEVASGVATLTLDRPDARNAFSDEMVESLVRAFDLAERDDDVRVLVLTGAGSAFCAGGDLKAMSERTGMFAGDPLALRRRYIEGLQRLPRRLAHLEKPIVAAINGPAIGAGLDLACMCDLRLAARGARFGSTFVKLGLLPGDGGAYFLARAIAPARALELLLTGRVIDAAEAERIGLVSGVVDPDELQGAAYSLAAAIASNAPSAVRLAKAAFYRGLEHGAEAALELAASYQAMLQNGEEHAEALRALAEGRPPTFAK